MPAPDAKPPLDLARRMVRTEWWLRLMAVVVFAGFALMMLVDEFGWDEAALLAFIALVLAIMLGVVAYARKTLVDLASRERS